MVIVFDNFDTIGQVVFECAEQGIVGRRVMENFPGPVDAGNPAQGQHDRYRASGLIEFLGYKFTDFNILFRCGPHRSHRGVMEIQGPMFKFFRNLVPRR